MKQLILEAIHPMELVEGSTGCVIMNNGQAILSFPHFNWEEIAKELIKNGCYKAARKQPKFQKPSKEEIASYFKELGCNGKSNQLAEKFFDYYESKGWKIGSATMKDWRSTCRNWKRRSEENGETWTQGKVKVIARGSVTPIEISMEEYQKSVQSGTNYYKLV